MLTRDQILGAADCKVEPVDVPEWGGSIYVRTFSGIVRDRIDSFVSLNKGDMAGMRALIVSLSACDQSGALIFKPDDVAALNEKSAAAMDRVVQAASKLNKLGVSEDAREDFSQGQSGASGSA